MPNSFNQSESYLATAECVTEGHPDKLCDQISDAILDAMLKQDPFARVACEVSVAMGMVIVLGEVTCKGHVEIPEIVRRVIKEAGYGEYFVHRTGHSIGEEVHGNGVNMDNLETRDERKIGRGTCFSIEPGIYLPDKKMGFRTEIDVFITEQGHVDVTGARQEHIIPILSK